MSVGVRDYSTLTREAAQEQRMRGLPVAGIDRYGRPAFIPVSTTDGLIQPPTPPEGHYVSRETKARVKANEAGCQAIRDMVTGRTNPALRRSGRGRWIDSQ